MRWKKQRPASTATDSTSFAGPGTEEKAELDGKQVRDSRDEILTPELASGYTSPHQTPSSDGLTPSSRGRGHSSGPGLSESGGAALYEMSGRHNLPELEGDPIVHELPADPQMISEGRISHNSAIGYSD